MRKFVTVVERQIADRQCVEMTHPIIIMIPYSSMTYGFKTLGDEIFRDDRCG